MRLSLVLCLLPMAAQAELAFDPVSVPKHVYAGGWEHFVGGGLAVFDCNNDNFPDLFAAGGTNPSQLLINTSSANIAFKEGTPDALALTGVTGAYPIDIDSDGILDIAILRVGADMILRGTGNCNFAPFETLNFQSSDHWTTAFSATWEQGETLPTLAFGTYVDRGDPDGPFEACDATQLYRPNGDQYGDPISLEPGFCTLSILFSDWNRNGHADLRISNDRHYYVRGGSEQMWTFDPKPRLYGAEDGWRDFAIWGMGIASRDLTGDGLPEVYLTSMGDQKLQIFDSTEGQPNWRDATYDFGTTAHRPHVGGDGRPSTGWHAQFADVNNDGRDDIFVTKGNVEQMPVAAMQDPNSLLMQNADGRFTEASADAGVASMERSRGAAVVDFNNDGLLDLAVINRRAPLEVFQNASSSKGTWLSVRLAQTGTNPNAIGAFIEVKTK
ncbi:VCBS repeat-containing protein, partial [Planktotalea sp.]|uniref:FG-GAP repeat domain-containing protein n=1 Tax=Planktotalea sp. TaxID=2029877 RepID=UPI003298E746